MTDILVPKSSNNFFCEKCYYLTYRKSQYDRHVLTSKHKNTDKILTRIVRYHSYVNVVKNINIDKAYSVTKKHVLHTKKT